MHVFPGFHVPNPVIAAALTLVSTSDAGSGRDVGSAQGEGRGQYTLSSRCGTHSSHNPGFFDGSCSEEANEFLLSGEIRCSLVVAGLRPLAYQRSLSFEELVR